VSIVLRPVVPTSDGCRSKFEGQTLQSAPQTGLFPKVNKNTLQSHKPAGSPRHLFTPSFRGIGFDVELASIGGGSSKRHSSTNGKSCFTKSLKNEIKKRKQDLRPSFTAAGEQGSGGGLTLLNSAYTMVTRRVTTPKSSFRMTVATFLVLLGHRGCFRPVVTL
jgi:hypothetical protein